MKSRKLGIALLVMLALVVTSGTFAYWAAGVTGPTADAEGTGTVNIGAGETITTEYVLTPNANNGVGALVPSGYEDGTTTFASRSLIWTLAWNDDGTANASLGALNATAPLTVTVSWVAYDDDGTTVIANSAGTVTTYTGAINVAADAGNATSLTMDAAAETFTFNLSIGEPASPAQYDLIASGSIVVTVTFSLGTITIS